MTFLTFCSVCLCGGGVRLLLLAVSGWSEACRGASARARCVGGRGRSDEAAGSRGGDGCCGAGCCGAGCCRVVGGDELLELDDEDDDEDEGDRRLAAGTGVLSTSGSTWDVLLTGVGGGRGIGVREDDDDAGLLIGSSGGGSSICMCVEHFSLLQQSVLRPSQCIEILPSSYGCFPCPPRCRKTWTRGKWPSSDVMVQL